jgi:Mycothiol maleylpyruvate isomerase N-terminal domain
MEPRAEELHSRVAAQIGRLIDLAADLDDADLRRPCPGRNKLGDGSVGTVIAHTTDNYLRIAAFVGTYGDGSEGAPPTAAPGHSRRFGHLLGGWRRHRPRDHGHGDLPAAGGADLEELRHRLSTARADLASIAGLDERRLDSIPPDGAFRFCDGRRDLEEVLTALLDHQEHQVEALELPPG